MPIEVVTEDGVFIASNSTLEITSAVNVKRLIIKSGNVFQPHSKLTISFYDISNNIDDGNEKEINLSIGSNNLFEEYSSVVMHYDWLDMEGVENNIEDRKIIGGWNHFSSYSKICCGSIGSGNVFEAKSFIRSYKIINGFIAAPMVSIDSIATVDDQNKQIDDDHTTNRTLININANDGNITLDNTVAFVLDEPINDYTQQQYVNNKCVVTTKSGWYHAVPKILFRRHVDGANRNKKNLQVTLPFIRDQLIKNNCPRKDHWKLNT